eukprot:COSAG06_NODE_4689_length_4035_cov_2.989837_3_plen_448_part_00
MELSLVETNGVGAEELVAVPSAVNKYLQMALGGPGAPSERKARLWALAVTSFFLAWAWIMSVCWRGYSDTDRCIWVAGSCVGVDPALVPTSALAGAGFSGVALVAHANVHMHWSVLYAPCPQDDPNLLPSQHRRLRDLVLRAELTPDAAATLLRLANQHEGWLLNASAFGLIVGGLLSYGFHTQGLLTVDMAAASAIFGVTAPISGVALAGVRSLERIAKVIVVDHVQLVTKRVRRSTPATADFDNLLAAIVEAQRLVSAVTTDLERPMLCVVVYQTMYAATFTFVGLGPQPTDPTLWWRQYHVADMFACLGGVVSILTILVLTVPARITSACDALGDAINELLEATEVGDDRGLHMPTKEQEQHIQSLLGYVRGLNRGKGMGFVILNKRITTSFVVAMIAKAVSAMVFLFPVMISLTRVEDQEAKLEREDALLLNTTNCAALCGKC